MRMSWKGHSCFLIETTKGTKVLTDPFNEAVGYPLPMEEVELVTVSHQHFDHNATSLLPGKPIIVDNAGEHNFADIKIKGISTYHDSESGAKRGLNNVYIIEADNIRICHLGDLGHVLTKEQLTEIGRVDVLCVPVGGFYTISPQEAKEVVEQLQPSIVLPMHYKYECVNIPIAPLEDFLKLWPTSEELKVLDLGPEVQSATMRIIKLTLS